MAPVLRLTERDAPTSAERKRSAQLLGNLVARTAISRHAELDVLHPVTHAAQRPINARICRNERVDYAYAYALACMLTHGWLDSIGDIAQLSPSFQ